MNLGIAFAPLVPDYVLWTACAVAAAIALLLLSIRSRGALMRVLALALLVLALANPSFTREDRDPIPSVAAVIVDKSPSQNFRSRTRQAEEARAALLDRLGHIAGLEVRVVEAGEADGETDGTRLFNALGAALADVPPDRIAGAIMITDGRVHDVPADAASLGFQAPLHALITGTQTERDRRIVLTTAPRFGIVGQAQTIVFRVEDQGAGAGPARISVRRDGETIETRDVVSGAAVRMQVPIPHAGANIVEIEASPLEDELTAVNNRAVISIDGVRDKLRVLLVSGEPHAGERTWRNLLKSDASVDLVHFTILRPPEKQDGTPINELSLIAFPTRELFQQKINEFHLIIFDRYARQGVLPIIYFDNIARYVREGGAVLVAAGPDYASPTSLWRTPLDAILPAAPVGSMTERAFHARLSDLGKRHPVTRALEGSASEPPHWSRWFRLVDIQNTTGTSVMEGPDGKPLLVLAREGEGRVALLLSDHIWLWARGFEGGGPHLDLLRRLSHWLMKQPDLEEEALRMSARGRELAIERQTMAESVGEVTVTTPSGQTRTLTLQPAEPGLWRGATPAGELGLWRATDGKLTTLVNVGPANPREFAEVTSTAEVLAPLANATGGSARRLDDGGTLRVPRVIGVRASETFKGEDWIGLKMRDVSVVRGIGVLPVFAGLLGLLLLVGSFAAMWAREGR
ncbi:MAG: membrane protein [Alphaproteobacteria bacterium]|nr:MAG: membrane protein [Alphaproteobacteria bacterium]